MALFKVITLDELTKTLNKQFGYIRVVSCMTTYTRGEYGAPVRISIELDAEEYSDNTVKSEDENSREYEIVRREKTT